MACAAFSAKAGAKVLVVEKQATVGGSSSYSAGMLYGFEPFSVDRSVVSLVAIVLMAS